MALPTKPPPVVLFGYDSSAFTTKIRLALRLKRIPYAYVQVPSMMPRPLLRDTFHLTYRKIPVLAVGRDVYADTSLILEALEHRFPAGAGFGTLYPSTAEGVDGRRLRPLMRTFASHYTDRPLFRTTTGLVPASVWRSAFGRDRAGLIGHALDPAKLERKVPRNVAALDVHLSVLEELFAGAGGGAAAAAAGAGQSWVFGTSAPSVADVALWFQLDWGRSIARGYGVENLTAGEVGEEGQRKAQREERFGVDAVFNAERYPGVCAWFDAFKAYVEGLPSTETKVVGEKAVGEVLGRLKEAGEEAVEESMVPTVAEVGGGGVVAELYESIGWVKGREVGVVPDDTGKGDPTYGTLLAFSTEEVVIKPVGLGSKPPPIDVRLHFPRVGFVVQLVDKAKL